ncbi:hypothetical protein BS78_02G152300 [Paspalum vaginatum]|nr:hypothetical protein BS78_02G152300 [Paspalum vaginatum]
MGSIDVIPCELLELILLLVASPVFLVRAASTCRPWHRIIAKADFLRRFHCRHGPTVAGHYYDGGRRFSPCWSPSIIDSRHFSLDFLHGNNEINPSVWALKDSRGSLLLFDHDDRRSSNMFIYEPATRPMCTLRVVRLVYGNNNVHAYVFTSDHGWKITTIESIYMDFIGLAMGSMYWHNGGRKMVTLNETTAKFSSFMLPDIEDWDKHMNRHQIAVTASRDGRVCIVVGGTGGDMWVFARIPSGTHDEWVRERRVLLMSAHSLEPCRHWYFNYLPISVHRTAAVLVITTTLPLSPQSMSTTPLMFRLDIETMEVECMPDPNMGIAHPCELPWPPAFRDCIQ